MQNKKLELKRLVIFLVLAFAISWIPAIILNVTVGFDNWFSAYKIPIFTIPVSYGPALANVITRLITKEGWNNSMLHLRLKNNLKYYFIAVFLVILMGISMGLMETFVYGGGDLSDVGHGLGTLDIIGFCLTSVTLVPLMAFNTFGEEFGWRGYMNQKMEPIIGTAGTVIVGGIIWGLWHAELTVVGHNFGTDYAGYPYTGILYMCLNCTFLGMAMMWLTKKTGSIYPAAIMHAANNFGAMNIGNLLISGVPEEQNSEIIENVIIMIPSYILLGAFFVLMLLDSKKKNSAKAE